MADLSTNEIGLILMLAGKLKREQRRGKSRPFLRGKTLGMIFQKPSTRTRVSFEVGMYQLGGDAVYLGASDIQLSRGETIEDTAKTLSLYLDCIMARVYNHKDVQTLARYASVPVINGLSDSFHPCQILADLMTIQEHKKKLKGLRLAWLGDGDNVCNDLMLGCAKTGISMTAACPKGYEPLEEIVELAKAEGKKTGVDIAITDDSASAVRDADIIATDTFISIGKEGERTAREATFLPNYQVNKDIMKLAKVDAIFMHCLPAKRGMEVTADVIDGKWSVVWQEAENRLHTQKALLCLLMKAAL
ncbi:MAG: ornithine carbamoyltransferase [Thermoproteota archaeon]|nr:ornithine carbamoyltransferase [Thermoproteota archaeon]